MESALRPRDIQARIRAGESPDSVAEAAQTTVDRIMSYANPVLAERAHIAERAQRASIRRRAGEGPARILGDTVAEQLRARNLDPDLVSWDSWRRDDGRWALVADFRAGEKDRRAEFVFDVQGRYVVAEDDDARWLVGEQPARPAQPQAAPSSQRRLSAIGADSLRLGDDAIELVADPVPGTAGPEERTVDLTQTARELRGGTPARADELGPTGDADWMATQATDRPKATRAHDSAQEADTAEVPARDPDPENEAKITPETKPDPEPEAQEPAPKKPGRKGRRASVPSWDEIMFGGGRSE